MCDPRVALGTEKNIYLPPSLVIIFIIRTVGEIWARTIENYNYIHQGEFGIL